MGLLLDDTLIMDADIPIDLIDVHPSNPNLHSPAQIEQLAESHNSYGQYRRVLVWARPDGRFTLVAGHGFTQGATLDGCKTIRAEVLPESVSASVVESILIADNQHGKNSTIDNDVLSKLLKGQGDSIKNLSSMGFTQAQANTLFLSVTNAHSADFLQAVINPPKPYQPTPFDPFPTEIRERPPTYEEELRKLGHTPSSFAAQAFASTPTRQQQEAGEDLEEEDEQEQEAKGLPLSTVLAEPLTPTSSIQQPEVGQWFPLTYTVQGFQRALILDAIKKAKGEYNLDTSAEAIVAICNHFLH